VKAGCRHNERNVEREPAPKGLSCLCWVLSIAEAAKILKISRGMAYKLANQGKLPVIRLGRKLIVPRKGLNGLLSTGWTA
jgi:excisionase family DNA binding protein